MAHTTTNVLIHFIFSTHHRAPLINPEIQMDLHAYLGGIIREIGAVSRSASTECPTTFTFSFECPSTHSVADVARLIKTNSSRWVHERWPQSSDLRMASRLRSL